MGILRHADKAAFAVLCALLIWYSIATVKSIKAFGVEADLAMTKAQELAGKVSTVSIPPPAQDPTQYVGRVKASWSARPWIATLTSADFYPKTPEPSR
ncbi:MAG TPA: hypothetical protein P5137_07835 [Candidatus Brocadiia bacterium]|nr:hypothetical protein [Candidatus Brocadiia bacterium]